MNDTTAYSGTTVLPTHQFSAYFTANTTYPSATIKTILTKGDGNVQAAIVALMLNAASGYLKATDGSLYPVQKVKDLWNLGVIGGSYTAAPGVIWGAKEVKKYLNYLMATSVPEV